MAETMICHDGPMDGQTAVSRYPAGFVAVDRPACRVWLYDRREDGFYARETDGRPLDLEKRLHAALKDDEWDVLAVPCLGLTVDLLDEEEAEQ